MLQYLTDGPTDHIIIMNIDNLDMMGNWFATLLLFLGISTFAIRSLQLSSIYLL